MANNRTTTKESGKGLRLSEDEARVLSDLSEAFDRYRQLSGLTEIEFLTLRKVEDIMFDMLAGRAHSKTLFQESAQTRTA